MRIYRRCLLAAAVLLSALSGSSQFPHSSSSALQGGDGFSIEQVLSAPFPSELVASPKGSRIAWAFNDRGRRDVWVAEGPEFKARRLTRYDGDEGQEVTRLAFTHDGERVIFVRGGNQNSAGEVPNPAHDPQGARQLILAASFRDGRVRELAAGRDPLPSPAGDQIVFAKDGEIHIVSTAEGSQPHPLFSARGDNGSPAWSPDGRKIAFVSRRSTHSFIGVYDFDKTSIRYIAPSIDRDSAPRWSPDGRSIAFIRQPSRGNRQRPLVEDAPDPWTIQVADASTLAVREIWRSGAALDDSPPRMAGDWLLQWAAADRIVFASEMDGWMRLYSIGANGGQTTALTPADCEWEHAAFTPDRREIIYSSNCGDIDRRHLARAPAAGGASTAITTGDGIEWAPAVTGDGKTVFYAASDARRPAMPFVKPLADGAASMLAAELLPRDFPSSKIVVPQQVIFRSEDGLDIHAQLFLPPSSSASSSNSSSASSSASSSSRHPAVIFMHGGPMRQMLLGWHNRYYYHNAYGFNQYLASRGYVVLSVNYRAGIGYGRAFREAEKRGARGASEYQDIVAGANYLRSRSDVDPARIGLWGGSYGGYLTALGLARNSDLFAAGVDIHGVHDWSLRISSSPWIDYSDRDAARIARESSPMGAVEKWRSPVLLIHGDDDRNVAFAQTVDLARRLRELKVHFEQVVYPDEVHDFLLHRHWLEIYRASADFFERFLKNAGKRAEVSRADLLLRGGTVFDGSGADARKADIGISGDRIVFIGDAKSAGVTAEREIDVSGLVVAPGFIDPHTHTAEDLSSPARKANENYLFQGVTTVVTGNDGNSPFPIGETLAKWKRQGIGTNAALLVGHGTIRRLAMGMSDAAPTREQLEKMKALVRRAMDEGATGMSTGLYYAPGNFATTEEVIELARVVAASGGVYDTHMRDESSYSIGLLGSIAEVIRIGREARLPVHISHIKALGVDVWGKSGDAIDMIERARAEGVEVTANQYPYTASGTTLTAAILPRWAEAGGNAEMLRRFDDPNVRPRLIAEMQENLRRRGGPDSLLLTSARDRTLAGKRLGEIAKAWKKTPIDAATAIIKSGGASVASFNMSEDDIVNFMRRPWVATGSDGSAGHPRKYGTYPRKLREYVYNRNVVSLPFAIRAGSALPAEALRITERGRIETGYYADIIVYDEKTIAERATYEQPERLAVGMKYVIVNGKPAIDDGKYTGALAGRALIRRKRDATEQTELN